MSQLKASTAINSSDEAEPLLPSASARLPRKLVESEHVAARAARARSLSVTTKDMQDDPKIKQALRYSVAIWTLAFDAALMLALFFLAGLSEENEKVYLQSAVVNFNYLTSTFDIMLLAIARFLFFSPLYANIAHMEPMSVRGVVAFITGGSFMYAIVKISLVNILQSESIPGGEAFLDSIVSCSVILTAVESYHVFATGAVIERVYKLTEEHLEHEHDAKKTESDPKKKKINRASLRRLLSLALPEWPILSVAMVALFLNSAANLLLPYVFGLIVDALVDPETSNPRSELNRSVVFLILVFAFASIFGFVRGWLFTLAGHRVVASLRKNVFAAVINQEVAFFDKTRTGEITSRLSSDTQVLQNAVTTNISMLVRYLFQITGSIIVLFILSWQLTLVMFAVVPVVAIGAVVYGRYLQSLQKQFQDELAGATTVAEEVISNLRTVRSFSKEERSANDYGSAVHKTYLIGRIIAMLYGIFQGVMGFIPLAAIGLILWYGGTLVIDGELTTGFLTSFLIYTMSVAMAFAFLSSLFGDFMAAVGASERIFELLDRKPTINTKGGKVLLNFRGEVQFDKVTFTYPAREDQVVLRDVSLKLEPGKVLALVGPSGGGKSTIVSLMERFYDVSAGAISVDGIDLREIDPQWYRANVALVSQEPVLFATSIRDNICYGVDREVPDAEVEAAARAANAHDFITSFSDGYKTQVGERGVRLSGGQKQRVAISRALLMNPRILLLDEATSALDAESEYLVQDAIDKAMRNRTVLVIAHRLSTVKNADVIAVLSSGTVVEMGNHESLLQKEDGLYRKLVNRQLQGQDMNAMFQELDSEVDASTAPTASA